jgi:hypothetical protein
MGVQQTPLALRAVLWDKTAANVNGIVLAEFSDGNGVKTLLHLHYTCSVL